ncbi:hypothetical protein Hypma_002381 [Hypsizygus marmoreus]|uniref:Uncharacterized protein n=1 Tax=Hypsizygus marmoreus TaxID=39966 RepID=A0A369J407_HYPMA|nr:hypothetical protein Hypma_002381 [Hypsizygus marmoreus]
MTQNPSVLLDNLATLRDSKNFQALIRRHLYPTLDSLPEQQRSSIATALDVAHEEFIGVGLIAFHTKSHEITDGLRVLKETPGMFYESQGEIMEDVVRSIASWLPILWHVGVERGLEHGLVHESLKFCLESYHKLRDTRTQLQFIDLDHPDLIIKDHTGKLVYRAEWQTTEHAILWVWRDLLLSSSSRGQDENLIEKFATDIKNLKLTDKLLMRLDPEVSPSPTGSNPSFLPKSYNANGKLQLYDAEERRDLLMNAHLSSEMRSAGPKAEYLLLSREMTAFEQKPTASTFKALVSARPELKEHLIAFARTKFLEPGNSYHSTDFKSAFEIFQLAGADQELLQLLDKVTAPGRPFSMETHVLRNAVSYLLGRTPVVQSRTRMHLERGLWSAHAIIQDEIYHAFYDLSAAWIYLRDQLDSGTLTYIAPAQSASQQTRRETFNPSGSYRRHPADPTRDPVLKAFCEKAGWTPAGEKDIDDDMYSDDDAYEEDPDRRRARRCIELEDLSLEAILSFQAWFELLGTWPQAVEREEMKAAVRAEWGDDGRLFFNVEGVADALACRCDDMKSDPYRERLGRGIRLLYTSLRSV